TPIDPLNYDQDDYAVWNSTGGVGTAGGGIGNSNVPDGTIAAGQGFFVVGNVVTAGSPLVFNNDIRLSGDNGMFFRPDGTQRAPQVVEKHRVWLELTNAQGAYKQTLVGYIQGATNQKEVAFDGVMIDGGNAVSLYSIADGYNLAIQGRALPFDTSDVVPLGFKVSTGGTYNIALSNFDGLFEGQDVFLEDLYLGTVQNLKTENYSFTAPAGTFNDRFQLRYNENALGTPNQFDDNSVVIYKNTQGIQVNTGNVDIKDVKVFDMRGRLVTLKEDVAAASLTVSLDVPQQVLIVQVTSQDNRVVTKKIVY
ncbi:MAG TPA: T9SS sorting signal type C domain-containing protein, partial [Flavobacterium sp.]|nr:T9SS sorting signal type C domain-containing protein [Flavobacterium sp.]